MVKARLVLAFCATLQGCAYLTTYKSDIGQPATGISIDAKQRLVLFAPTSDVTTVSTADGRVFSYTTSTTRRTCAEPSPDALSALSASLGASATSGSGSAKQLAAALGESAGSIGLRTTSIQLMRDAMYRVCESYLSGAIDGREYASLQTDAQNLIVGLLAIEQLTGAVKAQQMAVLASSGAGSFPDVVMESDRLLEKQKAVQAQKLVADEAKAQSDAGKKAVDDKQGKVDAANADPKAADEAKKQLASELEDAKKAATLAEAEEKSQAALLAIAKEDLQRAQAEFDFAKTRVRAFTNYQAAFGDQISKGTMSAEAAKHISDAVSGIVGKVVDVGGSSARCLTVVSRPDFRLMDTDQKKVVRDICDLGILEDKTKLELNRKANNLPPQ